MYIFVNNVTFEIFQLQDNTLVPPTPLMSAQVLKEEEDVWMDVQVNINFSVIIIFITIITIIIISITHCHAVLQKSD